MSETGDTGTVPKKKATSINSMLLADLKAVAQGMGITGAGSMKKAQLIDAIRARQDAHAQSAASSSAASGATSSNAAPADATGGGDAPAAPVVRTRTRGQRTARAQAATPDGPAPDGGASDGSAPDVSAPDVSAPSAGVQDAGGQDAAPQPGAQAPESDSQSKDGSKKSGKQDAPKQGGKQDSQKQDSQKQDGQKQKDSRKNGQSRNDQSRNDQSKNDQSKNDQSKDGERRGGKGQNQGQNQSQDDRNRQDRDQDRNQQDRNQQDRGRQDRDGGPDDDGDDEAGGRRSRRRRGRDRSSAGRPGRSEPDTTILEDDVLVPAAGILDVLDNYAFVRTSGYLPGSDDVYLSLSMVRKYGLRRGDALVGQVRHPREGERREKFNPMVRIDSVNGMDPEAAAERPHFADFTPIHPAERLRLESDRDNLLGRVVDVAAPIGKGQRGLVVAPPRSGKTEVVGEIASSVSRNNPECHLMVVLIDERPEEVTDYQRSVRGEVIASTFDRPAGDHILIAELAVERAKRLVELGHDVVVLMDSLTSLGRAYTSLAPGQGKVIGGGVDAAALHPAKQLFGAARNVEDGGSLTILATAIVETGSSSDAAIFEEFAGTANMELVLRGELARRRIFPPVDVAASSTRREEHLLGAEEQEILLKLRTALMDVEPLTALEAVLARMNATQSNVEFLTQVQKASASDLVRR